MKASEWSVACAFASGSTCEEVRSEESASKLVSEQAGKLASLQAYKLASLQAGKLVS